MFYFRAFFKCGQCSKVTSRIIKTASKSKFDAREKLGEVHCHLCINDGSLEFLEIEELVLDHLEEFIRWAPSESKLIIESGSNVSTVDI